MLTIKFTEEEVQEIYDELAKTWIKSAVLTEFVRILGTALHNPAQLELPFPDHQTDSAAAFADRSDLEIGV